MYISVERDTPEPAADGFHLNISESKRFLRIVMEITKIKCRDELFHFLQGMVQGFIPHQILICAWGNFRGANLNFDVISPIPGVVTGKANGCNIEQLLKDLYERWGVNGRRKMLLDNADARATLSSRVGGTDIASTAPSL